MFNLCHLSRGKFWQSSYIIQKIVYIQKIFVTQTIEMSIKVYYMAFSSFWLVYFRKNPEFTATWYFILLLDAVVCTLQMWYFIYQIYLILGSVRGFARVVPGPDVPLNQQFQVTNYICTKFHTNRYSRYGVIKPQIYSQTKAFYRKWPEFLKCILILIHQTIPF